MLAPVIRENFLPDPWTLDGQSDEDKRAWYTDKDGTVVTIQSFNPGTCQVIYEVDSTVPGFHDVTEIVRETVENKHVAICLAVGMMHEGGRLEQSYLEGQ